MSHAEHHHQQRDQQLHSRASNSHGSGTWMELAEAVHDLMRSASSSCSSEEATPTRQRRQGSKTEPSKDEDNNTSRPMAGCETASEAFPATSRISAQIFSMMTGIISLLLWPARTAAQRIRGAVYHIYAEVLTLLLWSAPSDICLWLIHMARPIVVRLLLMPRHLYTAVWSLLSPSVIYPKLADADVTMPQKRHVVLSSAGLAGTFYRGALLELWDVLHPASPRARPGQHVPLVGSSAGAVVAAVYLACETPQQFDNLCEEFCEVLARPDCVVDALALTVKPFMARWAHKLFTDRAMSRIRQCLYVTYINASSGEYVVDGAFKDVEHLLDALLASSHTPLITSMEGPVLVRRRNIRGVDGAHAFVFPVLYSTVWTASSHLKGSGSHDQDVESDAPVLLTPFQHSSWAEANLRVLQPTFFRELRGNAPYAAMTNASQQQMDALLQQGNSLAKRYKRELVQWASRPSDAHGLH